MITGTVRYDEPRIRLKVMGRRGQEEDVEAIVDSGFTGALTLPPNLIAALDLRWQSMDTATLADGGTCVFQVYVGKVLWDGKVRSVLVAEAETDPLVGMRLLRGHELRMQVRSRGKVTIKRLRPKAGKAIPHKKN
jgi:clan AA aspartic protease